MVNVIKLLMKVLVSTRCLEIKQNSHKQTIIVKLTSELHDILKNYTYFLNFHPVAIVSMF